MITALLGCGAGLVLMALSGYAVTLWLKVHRQFANKAQKIARRQQLLLEHIQRVALAVEQAQCDRSEGTIRLIHLLQALPLPSEYSASSLPGLYGFYDIIKAMPILEDRKTLPPQERRRLDKQRLAAEKDFSVLIDLDVQRLSKIQVNSVEGLL